MNLLKTGFMFRWYAANSHPSSTLAKLSKGLQHLKVILLLILWITFTCLFSSAKTNTDDELADCDQLAIQHMSLLNADNASEIQKLTDGDVLLLSELPSKLAVTADIGDCQGKIRSVRFELSGPQSLNRVENLSPYSMYGDTRGNHRAYSFEPGDYTLAVTPYSSFHGKGTRGESMVVSFTVREKPDCSKSSVNADPGDSQTISCETGTATLDGSASVGEKFLWVGPSGFRSDKKVATVRVPGKYTLSAEGSQGCKDQKTITVLKCFIPPSDEPDNPDINCFQPTIKELYLINAQSNKQIELLEDGAVLGLNQLPDYLNIQAAPKNCMQKTGSVFFELFGPDSRRRTESKEPFALFGDNSGNYLRWKPRIGKYRLRVTPYALPGRKGAKGASVMYQFEIKREMDTGPSCADIDKWISITDPGEISCKNQTVTIEAKVQDGLEYSWKGPNDFSSTDLSIIVSQTGTYVLTATNGECETARSISITEIADPQVFLTEQILMGCNESSVRLSGRTLDARRRYWNGPNGFTSKRIDAEVSVPGFYVLTAESSLGCITKDSLEVVRVVDLPELSAGDDGELTCNTPVISLEGKVEGAVEYAWTGPGGFSSTELAIVVDQPGLYILEAVSPSQCVQSDSVWISQGMMEIKIEAGPDILLGCGEGEVRLSGIVPEGFSIAWSGPDSFSSDILEAPISIEGTYILQVTAPNGCMDRDTVEIISDLSRPDALAGPDIVLDCISGNGILEAHHYQNVSYEWAGPEGFVALEPTIEVSKAGRYVLTATGNNLCYGIDTVEVKACEVECEGMRVTEVSLINARTGKPWQSLSDGDTLYTTSMPDALSILASTQNCLYQVRSVRFNLSGAQEIDRVDNADPWSLMGDSEGTYLRWDYQPGSYQLIITPYSERLGEGEKGVAESIQFTIVEPSLIPEGAFAMRINCGESTENSYGGHIFSSDQYFSGQTEVYQNPFIYDITGTSFDELYKTSRTSADSVGKLTYKFPVPNGTYIVYLHFAEIYWGADNGAKAADNTRLFDVHMEGNKVGATLNLLKEAGSMAAYVFQHRITVTDSILDLRLEASSGTPILAGIEILSSDIEDLALVNSLDYAIERTALGANQLGVEVFPNPLSGQGILILSGPSAGSMEIHLIDQSGREWMSREVQKDQLVTESTIDLTDLPKGIYAVIVSGKNTSGSKLIVVY
ncbi:MAG: malectin domain-containing carbohydrate-binding protein [Bacteroidota bacterium]